MSSAKTARDVVMAKLSEDDREHGDTLLVLAKALQLAGRYAAALPLAERGRDIIAATVGEAHGPPSCK